MIGFLSHFTWLFFICMYFFAFGIFFGNKESKKHTDVIAIFIFFASFIIAAVMMLEIANQLDHNYCLLNAKRDNGEL